MGGIFNYDGKFSYAIRKVADIIIASVLWIIGCLPLITIGTSTTALYYASIKAVLGEGAIAKNFWKSYKENLKQSIVVELLLCVVAYIMYLNWKILFEISDVGSALKVIFFVVLIWLVSIVCYIFPILSRFVLSTKMLIVNAFVLSIKNLPRTVFIILTSMFPIICLVIRVDYVIKVLPMIVLMVPGLIAYINSMMFVKIFEQYTTKEEVTEE